MLLSFEEVKGLRYPQIEGIKLGLSREQVMCENFD